MEVLHVATLPFPTTQGTQAAIHQIATRDASTHSRVVLLCYGHANADVLKAWNPIYEIQRVSLYVSHGERSGPSWRKIFETFLLGVSLWRLIRHHTPQSIIAHNVEAAALMQALCGFRCIENNTWVYAMHTSLAIELPTYFEYGWQKRLMRTLGFRIDQWLLRRAPSVQAVSPWLRRYARKLTQRRDIERLHLPWRWSRNKHDVVPKEPTSHTDLKWVLYCGNLDKYQNVYALMHALPILRSHGVGLLLATASESHALQRQATELGIPFAVHSVRVFDDILMRRLYNTAHGVVVPRSLPGGIPIKVLDALQSDRPLLISFSVFSALEPQVKSRHYAKTLGIMLFDEKAASLVNALSDFLLLGPLTTDQKQARISYLKKYYG